MNASTVAVPEPSSASWRRVGLWLLCGLGIAGATCVPRLGWRLDVGGVNLLDFLREVAAVLYLLAVWLASRARFRAWLLIPMVLVAVAIRAPVFTDPPSHHADYQRYLWDGAMVAEGVNPYRYSVLEILGGRVSDPVVRRLSKPGTPGERVLRNMNHYAERSFYPPVIQALFAVAYRIRPFDVRAWRTVMLAFDVLAALLVASLLWRAGLPKLLLAGYLWNPVICAEGYGGGHMDLVLAALLMGFVWFLLRRMYVGAAVALVLCAGVKLWPAGLIFFLVGRLRHDWRQVLPALAVFALLLGLFVLIPLLPALGPNSGLIVYSKDSEAFSGLYHVVQFILVVADFHVRGALKDPIALARPIVALLIAGFAIVRGLRWRPAAGELETSAEQTRRLCLAVGHIILFMLLVNHTSWPWYYMTLIPLAAIAPRPSLLAWTLLMPAVWHFEGMAQRTAAMLIVHPPVLILLWIEHRLRRRRAAREAASACSRAD